MKRIFTVLLLLLLCSFTPAQWLQTNGPYGWGVNTLIAIPNGTGGTNIIAGTNEGIFLSQDDGKTWIAKNSELKDLRVECLVNIGSTVIAGTYWGGFLSTNYGADWTAINDLDPYEPVWNIAIHDSNIFASTMIGLYLSTDNGNNWNKVITDLYPNVIECMAFEGTNIFAASSDSGVIFSTNNGINWKTVNTGLPNTYSKIEVQSIAIDGINIFAGMYDGEIFLSTNNGANWKSICNGLYVALSGLSFLVDSPNVYAANSHGVYLTTNNGLNWNSISSGLNNEFVYSLAMKDNDLYAGAGGVFRSSKSDIHWIPLNKAISITKISAIVTCGSNLLAGGRGENICLSTNQGTEWTTVNSGVRNSMVTCMAVSGSNVYAGTDSSGVLFSSDSGLNWISINNALPSKRIRGLGIFNSDLYVSFNTDYPAAISGIYHSTDNGNNWTRITYINFPQVIKCFQVKDSVLYAGGDFDDLYYTTNNGGNWNRITLGLNTSIESLVFRNDDIYILTDSYAVLKSTDNGKTWNSLISNSSITTWANSDSVFFAGGFNTVFLSTNNGTNWSNVRDGIPTSNDNILSLTESDSFAFAGLTSSGVWRRPLSEIMTSVKESLIVELPEQFTLSQNYPNPFNPSTTINYSLPHSGNVKLTVYNSIGSKVATLVNEYKPTGTYSVQFNAFNLASGIYFYRLESGTYSATKKLLLLK